MAQTSWLERLSGSLDQAVGESERVRVMQGCEAISSGSAPGTKARWVCGMLARLEQATDEETRTHVLDACHCPHPGAPIRRLKALYDMTHRVDALIEALQVDRRQALLRRLGDDAGLWKLAQTYPFFNSPIRDGNPVIHITAPYHPPQYLRETDFARKRAEYCHCGWINGSKENIPRTFCACGAGYYRALWEGMLGMPVEVDIFRSVLSGDEDCRMRVTLPVGVL